MKKLHKDEEELIKDISDKYQLEPKYFKTLLKIEKDYANKNMGRRGKIFKEINEMIDIWTGNY